MMSPYARFELAAIPIGGGLLALALMHVAGAWALLVLVPTLALLLFYRDPPRRTPRNPHILVAPADGRVVALDRDIASVDNQRVLRIMIFLSVLDVHLNRSPCAGRVTAVDYRPGRFRNALSAAADTENECNTITITPAEPLAGPVRVRQIAGVLARRIVCAVGIDDVLTAGQRVGMIKLGSRTELCVPADERWVPTVRVGDHVRAGVTILLRWQPDDAS